MSPLCNFTFARCVKFYLEHYLKTNEIRLILLIIKNNIAPVYYVQLLVART